MPQETLATTEFMKNLYEAEWIPLLPGIRGRSGVHGLPPGLDLNMGADLIEMEPGTAFPLHTHPGAHILFILNGTGTITIGEQVYPTRPGDCLFVPGDVSHGVGATEKHTFLAVGFPHKELVDAQRMDIVDEEYLHENPMIAQVYSGDDHEKRTALLHAFQHSHGHSHGHSHDHDHGHSH